MRLNEFGDGQKEHNQPISWNVLSTTRRPEFSFSSCLHAQKMIVTYLFGSFIRHKKLSLCSIWYYEYEFKIQQHSLKIFLLYFQFFIAIVK